MIGSFDAPQGHGMDVDSKGFVYIGQNTVRKYDPKTGKLVGESRTRRRPRAAARSGGQRSRTTRRAGQRGSRRRFLRRLPEPADAAVAAATPTRPRGRRRIAAFRAKYPPTTPMIVGGIEEIRLDEAANEIYVADNYLGGRVMVFDLDTFAVQARLGRLRPQAVGDHHQRRRPRLHAGRADAEGVRGPPDAQLLQRRTGLCRRSQRQPHPRHRQARATS